MSATWIETARRLLPRLARVAREIRPTLHLDSVRDLSSRRLGRWGIGALLWDVDGTLMAHHAHRVDPGLAEAFEALLEAPGVRHAIVSNCQEERFAELGEIFPSIPVVLGYETREGAAFRIRHGSRTSWRGPGAVAASAEFREARPIRKPSRRLVEAALAEVGLAHRPEAVLMVGDQYFTDIASANLAGIRSAKVPTLHRSTFPAPVRLSQRLEGLLYRLAVRDTSRPDGEDHLT